MSQDNAKLLIAAGLFGTWVALVGFKVAGAEDIVAAIKLSLTGLWAHILTVYPSTPANPTQPAAPAQP